MYYKCLVLSMLEMLLCLLDEEGAGTSMKATLAETFPPKVIQSCSHTSRLCLISRAMSKKRLFPCSLLSFSRCRSSTSTHITIGKTETSHTVVCMILHPSKRRDVLLPTVALQQCQSSWSEALPSREECAAALVYVHQSTSCMGHAIAAGSSSGRFMKKVPKVMSLYGPPGSLNVSLGSH